jgi:hypothetical protein
VSEELLCPRCGKLVAVPPTGPAGVMTCRNCGEHFRLTVRPEYKVPEAEELELDKPSSVRMQRKDPWADVRARTTAGAAGLPLQRASEFIPAAPPIEHRDPNRALVSTALGLFHLHGWPCQELSGYRAFMVEVAFQDPESGQQERCPVRVSARNRLLVFDTILMPLPPQPWFPLREALNAANALGEGSVFALIEQGVLQRHLLVPRAQSQGCFAAETLMETLQRVNHDRRRLLSVIKPTIQSGKFDPAAMEAAFASPEPPGEPWLSRAQLHDLSSLAGFSIEAQGETLYLSRGGGAPIALTLQENFLRGVAMLNPAILGRWLSDGESFLSSVFHKKWTAPKLDKLELGTVFSRLNALNEGATLLRYYWANRQLQAAAVLVLNSPDLTLEEFQPWADLLHRCASKGEPAEEPDESAPPKTERG